LLHPKGQNFRSPEAVTGQWQQMADESVVRKTALQGRTAPTTRRRPGDYFEIGADGLFRMNRPGWRLDPKALRVPVSPALPAGW